MARACWSEAGRRPSRVTTGAARRLSPVAGALAVLLGAMGAPLIAEPGQDAGGRDATRAPAGSTAAAVESARQQARLASVRKGIDALRRRLQDTEARAGSVVDAIDEIDLTVALLTNESVVLREEMRAAAGREAAARDAAEQLAGRLAASEQDMRRWLAEAYKVGPVRYVRLVAAAGSPSQMAAARRAVEALSLAEGRRIQAYREERLRFDQAIETIAFERQRLVDMEGELARKSAALRDNRRRKESVLAALKRERASQKTALIELQQTERQIRELLARLTRPDAGKTAPSTGFARHRGRLEWPTRGKLALPFGNVRHPRFSTVVPHPGIDIAATPGQDVRSVFDGRVVFSDWFKGYGQMIVIDHGDGFLSIYGHVQERLVDSGETVARGDVIGRSGQAGTFDLPGLYFEIRSDGKPEDPALWLSSPSSKLAEGGTRGRRPAGTRTAP